LLLAPEELASLLDALVEASPSCLDRFVLTDARGASPGTTRCSSTMRAR